MGSIVYFPGQITICELISEWRSPQRVQDNPLLGDHRKKALRFPEAGISFHRPSGIRSHVILPQSWVAYYKREEELTD